MERNTKNERRRAVRQNIRSRVRLRAHQAGNFENAHLVDFGQDGLYVMTRFKLNIGQEVEIAVPSEADEDHVKITAKVIRKGTHRSWGLFSYGCRLLSTR